MSLNVVEASTRESDSTERKKCAMRRMKCKEEG